MKKNDLSDRVLDFAARIGKLVDKLPNTRLGNHVAGQLVRCGTSPLPNYEEACAAESHRDFIHKMRICLKELRESRAWLRLIERSRMQTPGKMKLILIESEELCNIFGKSILTASTNASRKKSK